MIKESLRTLEQKYKSNIFIEIVNLLVLLKH